MSTQGIESDTNSTLTNDNLTVIVNKKPHCQVKFDIQVKPHAAQAAYQKAIKNISKEVSIPGFRKGKAPQSFILEKYSSSIQKEFVDLVLQIGFNEAVELTHLHPAKNSQIKRPVVQECSLEKGAHFTIEFETRPIVPSIKLEEIQTSKITPTPVTEKDKENALHNLLLQFATYEPVEGRPVQEGDFINLSVKIVGDSPQEVIQNQRTQVAPSGLPSWLREKVIGLHAGESAEGMTEQDLTLSEPDPSFQSVPFEVTVHSIWKGELPAFDEALAKRVGLESVDQLQEKIQERLEQQAKDNATKEEIRAIEKLLVEKYPFDIPQSLIDYHKENQLTHYFQNLEEESKDYSQEMYAQVGQSIEQQTIYHLHLHFLLRKLAAEHHIEVDQSDLSNELTRQISLAQNGRSSLNFSDNKEALQEQLYHLALDRKIKQFLIDHITFKE